MWRINFHAFRLCYGHDFVEPNNKREFSISFLFISKQSLLHKTLSLLLRSIFSFHRILSSHLKLCICIYVKYFSCSSLLWLGGIHMIEIKISNILSSPLFHYPPHLSFSYPVFLSPSDGVLICRWNVKSTKMRGFDKTDPFKFTKECPIY